MELKAVSLSLQAFLTQLLGKAFRLFTDYTTELCVNKQGGEHSILLCQAAESPFLWCLPHRIILSARLTRQTQHPGGLVEQVALCAADSLDHHPSLPLPHLGAGVQTDGRPISIKVQPSPIAVLFTASKPSSSGGRPVRGLDRSPGYALPLPSILNKVIRKSRRRREDDSHHTSVASPTLVSRPVSHALPPSQTVSAPGPTLSFSVRSVPQQPQAALATCVEVLG